MQTQNPYSILGVDADAPLPAIRRAFHRLALLLHPDKLPSGTTSAERVASEERFKAVANAYALLSDPARRAAFDAGGADPSPCASFSGRTSRDVFAEYFGGHAEDDGAPFEVATVEPEDVFNLPLFEGYLVLDPRPAAERAVASVASSLPVDARAVATGGWGAWFAAAADDFSHDRASPVVVLGDPGGTELAASLALFLAAAPELGPPLPAAAACALTALRAAGARVRVVRGGTTALLGAFPLLAAAWGASEPTPHAVAPGVLLGSRAVGFNARTLVQGLGVTHALVAGAAHADGLPGVVTLALDVADAGEAGGEDAAALAEAWQRGCDFIDAARAAGGTVLVQLHGRSRSAGFALAWLARAHGLPASLAARVLRQKCPSVDWTLSAVPQLVEWLRAQAPAARLEP